MEEKVPLVRLIEQLSGWIVKNRKIARANIRQIELQMLLALPIMRVLLFAGVAILISVKWGVLSQ